MKSYIYNISEVKEMLGYFSAIFDIVRLVHPSKRKVVTIDETGHYVFADFFCHNVWNKSSRCENCVSMKSFHLNARMTKYEFINKDVYNIVAKPIDVIDSDGNIMTYVVELVNNITDEILFDAFGREEFVEKINGVGMKIYTDSLTGTFNRRYYDEGLFCHNSNYDISRKVAFIMVDLKKFKKINDEFGHSMGDYTLRQVGKTLQRNIRVTDSVIRIGGDEFLVVLSGCDKNTVENKINLMRTELSKITYGDKEMKFLKANLGFSYTDKFIDRKDFIEHMLDEADKNMYLDKNATIE